ncbi:hypothetical protein ACFQ6V_09285 [Streptomyces roseifaciens]
MIESDIELGLSAAFDQIDEPLLDLEARLRMHVNRLLLHAQAAVLKMKRDPNGGPWVRPYAHVLTARRLLTQRFENPASVVDEEQCVRDLAQNAKALLAVVFPGSDARA